MSSEAFFYFIIVGLPMFLILCGVIYSRQNKEASYAIDPIADNQIDYSEEVWKILMSAYTKLRKGRVAGIHPWISACIAEIDKGGDCPPDVAEVAVWKTLKEIPRGRYNVAFLYTAIMKLKELGGRPSPTPPNP